PALRRGERVGTRRPRGEPLVDAAAGARTTTPYEHRPRPAALRRPDLSEGASRCGPGDEPQHRRDPGVVQRPGLRPQRLRGRRGPGLLAPSRSEDHTSELQSRSDLVCRLLLEKKKKQKNMVICI